MCQRRMSSPLSMRCETPAPTGSSMSTEERSTDSRTRGRRNRAWPIIPSPMRDRRRRSRCSSMRYSAMHRSATWILADAPAAMRRAFNATCNARAASNCPQLLFHVNPEQPSTGDRRGAGLVLGEFGKLTAMSFKRAGIAGLVCLATTAACNRAPQGAAAPVFPRPSSRSNRRRWSRSKTRPNMSRR